MPFDIDISSFANIFMGSFEGKYVYTHPKQSLLYVRFLDDIFFIWQHCDEDLEKVIEKLNTSHPKITLTAEISDSEVSFLDTEVHIDPDGKIWMSL